MKALITGAGGFCGRYLTEYLQEQGVEVHTLGSGQATSARHHAVPDVTDARALTEIAKTLQPDYLFHLAGIAQASDPALYYRINTQYAVALLMALENAGLNSCITVLVGTGAEYGIISPDDLPIHEETIPRPYNHYGISKLAQTLEGLSAARRKFPVIVVRPFNIIGPHMPQHISIQSFASQIAAIVKRNALPVMEVGNLDSVRDFIDVRDVVRILWQLVSAPAAQGQIINMCTGNGVVMRDVLAKLISLSGKRIEVRMDAARLKPLDIPVHFGSVRKLEATIGPVRFTDLDHSLALIMEDLLKS